MTLTSTGRRITVGVDSEIGALCEVIVHRPGLELDRLTPGNTADLLFDDVLWASRARSEHDAFVEALRDNDVTVHLFSDLLAGALATPDGRAFALDRTITPERLGASLAHEVRALFDDADPATLAEYLIGGVTKADLSPLTRPSLAWQALDIDDFVLAPLPNTLFQRDNAAWIGAGLVIGPMAKAARRRESVNTRTVYRYHPLFRDARFPIHYGDGDADHAQATAEGGDIHVIAPGVVLIGMGERTTPTGVEALARHLFAAGEAHHVLVVELPKARSAMHLDTLLTMVDFGTFVAHPYLDWNDLRCWRLTPGGAPADLDVQESRGAPAALAQALDAGPVKMLIADADADRSSALREQWDDPENYLAIAPGVVMGYDRNVVTNTMLGRNGIDVIPLAGSELGRGGARCMSCPVHRHPLWATGALP